MTVLAKDKIIDLQKSGDLLIEPFCLDNVKNSSYDVTLGHWYWRERKRSVFSSLYSRRASSALNMYSESSVRSMWEGPYKAEALTKDLPGIPKGTPVIMIEAGENLLCHTHEFIGSVDLKHTTMMKARSSIGRNQITIAACAGWGDIGFANRWCLEVSNRGNYRSTILVPGRTIGQVVFMETTGLNSEKDAYFASGRYQTHSLAQKKFSDLESSWNPEDLLPRMWMDYKNKD